ncbi:MAG: RHS repeat-associated core domain-containing protein, partial [Chloroflexales bacterium]|nr:RHS repeat-associated core domain-containing protein [Chloroflexales bacterium]
AFGFTGELQDGETNLVYLRARWYDPGMGRFVSRDPFAGYMEQPYSLNAYQYAYSNPSLLTDPTGKCTAFLSYLAVGSGNYHADLVLDDCRPEVCGCNLASDHWRKVPYRACRKVPPANGLTSAVWMMRAGPEVPNQEVPFHLAVLGLFDDIHPWGKLLVREARDFGTDDVQRDTGTKIGGELAEVEGGDGVQARRRIMAENGRPCDEYIAKLKEFERQFNNDPNWNMTSNPLLRNSNAALRHALEFAGMPRPRGNVHMGLRVPGWEADLLDPFYYWPETSSINGLPFFGYVPYKRSERGER